jgi:hypothetical protein
VLGQKINGNHLGGLWSIAKPGTNPVVSAAAEVAGQCANCGRPMNGRRFSRVDASGIAGQVCSACSGESRYALSFG